MKQIYASTTLKAMRTSVYGGKLWNIYDENFTSSTIVKVCKSRLKQLFLNIFNAHP